MPAFTATYLLLALMLVLLPLVATILQRPEDCIYFGSPLFLSLFWFGPDDGKFAEAVHVLLTWLERGEVNRRNANNFYSMIQSSNGHIRRLTTEKSQHEKEMEEAKEKFKTALAGIVGQCESHSLSPKQQRISVCLAHRHTIKFTMRTYRCSRQIRNQSTPGRVLDSCASLSKDKTHNVNLP